MIQFSGNFNVCGPYAHGPMLFKILSAAQRERQTEREGGGVTSVEKDYENT